MISIKPKFVKRLDRINKFPLSIILFILVCTGCNQSLRFASVKYNAADINHLLDSTSMEYLTLLYNSPEASSYKSAFTLISYARDSTGTYLSTPAYNLAPAGKISKTFKGKTILGNLTLERDSIIALLKDPVTGLRKKDFAYLLFIPMRDKEYNYLYFDIKVGGPIGAVGDTSATQKTVARPCPPAVGCKIRAVGSIPE